MLDTTPALLQALLEGDSYGLELIERIKAATNGRVRLVQGRVYPALRALEQDGLLTGYWSEALPERGGRPRRYYALTAEGRRVARQDAKALAGLLKPFFGVA